MHFLMINGRIKRLKIKLIRYFHDISTVVSSISRAKRVNDFSR